jgi:hypothetical protein
MVPEPSQTCALWYPPILRKSSITEEIGAKDGFIESADLLYSAQRVFHGTERCASWYHRVFHGTFRVHRGTKS